MPTSYTSFIENGKVKSAKQFLHLCLRAFGVCTDMRDSSLEVKDDYTKDILNGSQQDIDYHKELLERAEQRLSEIKSLSEEELRVRYIKETKKRIEDIQKCQTHEFSKYGDYLRIRKSIRDWDCDPEFQKVKVFALDQIDISIPDDSYYEEKLAEIGAPTNEGFQERKEQYLQKLIDEAQWDVNYHREEMENAVRRRDEKIRYYNGFKKELNKLK